MIKKPTSTPRLDTALADSLAGLIFNASLFALPIAAASLALTLTTTQIIDYAPTENAKRETARAINAEASRFIRPGEDRVSAWSQLVLRELDEGDAAAARGFVLNAQVMLPGKEKARINRSLPPGADDNDLIAAAAEQLDDVAKLRFQRAGRTGIEGAFDVLGDSREVATQAQRYLAGEPVDTFLFSLSGATLALGAPDLADDDVRLGASVVKIARSSARLPLALGAMLERKVAAALPPARLYAEISAAFQDQASIVDDGAAATLAFSRAVDRDAYRILAADLAQIGAMARSTSPAGAVQLLRDADTEQDLAKLRLIAEASRERAVAVAKRSPERLILKAAKGQIKWSERLVGDLAALLVVLVGLFGSLTVGVRGALATIRAQKTAAQRSAAKAEAVRVSRKPPPPPVDAAA